VKNSKKRILLPPAAKQLKSLAEFHTAHGANKLKSVAEDDMRVRSDTLQRLER